MRTFFTLVLMFGLVIAIVIGQTGTDTKPKPLSSQTVIETVQPQPDQPPPSAAPQAENELSKPPEVAPTAPPSKSEPPAADRKDDSSKIDKSGNLQSERRKLIRDLIAKGVFKSHTKTKDNIVHLVVTPSFMRLDYDQKNIFVSVVYAYHFETTAERNMVILDDSKHNRRVGIFCTLRGGLEME